MTELFGTFLSRKPFVPSTIADLFPRTEDTGASYVVNYYGIADGDFTIHSANPYLALVQRWGKWGSIGDRVILVSIDIDLSGSVYSLTPELKATIVNSIKALRSDKYAFTQATWLRVTGYNSDGVQILIDWSPLDEITIDAIPDLVANGGTPIASADMLSLNSERNMAAAVKAQTDLKVVICKLNVGDGRENGHQPFEAEDVREYAEMAEFVDPAGKLPMIHALHRTMLHLGASDIMACEDYARRSGAAFDHMSEPTQRRMTNWFVERVHTASALGEESEDEETEGVKDFAAEAEASDTDAAFAVTGEDD